VHLFGERFYLSKIARTIMSEPATTELDGTVDLGYQSLRNPPSNATSSDYSVIFKKMTLIDLAG